MKFDNLCHWLGAATFLGSSLLTTAAAAGTAASTAVHTSFGRGLRGGTPHTPHTLRDLQREPPRNEPVTCAGGTYIVEVEHGDDRDSIVNDRNSYSDSYISCETSGGKSYKVNGMPDSVESEIRTSISGRIGIAPGIAGRMPELRLPEGSVVNESTATIDLPAGGAVNFEAPDEGGPFDSFNPFDRRDLAVTGTRSVLVVRVVAADTSTTQSVERLSNSVFGNGADGSVDPVTMRSQYLDCSYNQLEFVEATDRDGTDINIRNGACERTRYCVSSGLIYCIFPGERRTYLSLSTTYG